MAKMPSIATPPNVNPKLADYLKAGGSSAKPPTARRSQGGGLPRNKRGNKP
jgi:hypothetical protein